MFIRGILAVSLACAIPQLALAQSTKALSVPAEELPVTTEAELETLIGQPLQRQVVAPAGSESLSQETEELYVIGIGEVKSASEWTAADSNACKASGGVELPISAGRIACFAL